MYQLQDTDLIFKDLEQARRFIAFCEKYPGASYVDESMFQEVHFWDEKLANRLIEADRSSAKESVGSMTFYIVVRSRCFIDVPYIKSILDSAVQLGSERYWNGIYGPYPTIEDANKAFDIVMRHVDDDDYGIFGLDGHGKWWRIPWGELSRMRPA